MNASKTEPLEIHDNTALFREALRFTAAETGFIPRLIEKDYFCTLVLQHLCEAMERGSATSSRQYRSVPAVQGSFGVLNRPNRSVTQCASATVQMHDEPHGSVIQHTPIVLALGFAFDSKGMHMRTTTRSLLCDGLLAPR